MSTQVIQSWSDTSETELPAVASAVLDSLAKAAVTKDGATVLGLAGNLGAGKTTFTKACAEVLGVTETITSPTFVIMKQYATTHSVFARLIHIDAYRIEDEAELTVLGWEELLQAADTLIILEWPSMVSGLMPVDSYTLSFTLAQHNRDITLTSYGS